MTFRYLKFRSVFVIILTLLSLVIGVKQSFLFSLIESLFTGAFSFLVSSFLREPIDRALHDKIEWRRKIKNSSELKLIASNRDNVIYAIDYGIALTLPSVVLYFVFKNHEIRLLLQRMFTYDHIFLLFFICCFLYFAFILLIFRKRYYLIYSLLWISVPISGALNYFNSALHIIGTLKSLLFSYTPLMTCFITTVAVLDFLDKKIQEKNSIRKKYWNALLRYLSWEFVLRKNGTTSVKAHSVKVHATGKKKQKVNYIYKTQNKRHIS